MLDQGSAACVGARVQKQRPTVCQGAGHKCRRGSCTQPLMIVHLHPRAQRHRKRLCEQPRDHIDTAAYPERLHEHDHTATQGHATGLPIADGASIADRVTVCTSRGLPAASPHFLRGERLFALLSASVGSRITARLRLAASIRARSR